MRQPLVFVHPPKWCHRHAKLKQALTYEELISQQPRGDADQAAAVTGRHGSEGRGADAGRGLRARGLRAAAQAALAQRDRAPRVRAVSATHAESMAQAPELRHLRGHGAAQRDGAAARPGAAPARAGQGLRLLPRPHQGQAAAHHHEPRRAALHRRGGAAQEEGGRGGARSRGAARCCRRRAVER
ncbi:hypothetical protein ON010_g10181 [Phytophthora cinnamomi]|nr:hypothetical protein ON010_g10181 [Phytophthora cinnamomi]